MKRKKRYFQLIAYSASSDPVQELSLIRKSFEGLFIQSFNEELYRGRQHLSLVLDQTLYAKEKEQLLARDEGVDFLMRMTGEGQISQAMKSGGVKPGGKSILVIADSKKRVMEAVQFSLQHLKDAKRLHGLKEKDEREALLMAERSALLGLDRIRKLV